MNYKSNFNVRPSGISSGFVEFERNVVYPELVENGDFSQLGAELTTPFTSGWNQIGSNGWSLNPTPVNGGLEGIEATNYVYQGLTTAIGKQYQVVVDATVVDGSCYARGFNANNIIDINVIGRKTYSAIFTETDTNTNFGFSNSLEEGFTGIIHSVSVKELGVGWQVTSTDSNNNVEFNVSTARLKFLNTSPITELRTSEFILTSGKTYKLIVDIALATSGSIKFDTAGVSLTFNTAGVFTNTITPTSNTRVVFYRASSNVDITLNSVSVTEVGEATESALPNQSECEAYGYTWNSGNRTCQAFNPSITLERIAGNLSNNLYGSNNKTQRGTQNSMTIGDFNSINGSTENNLIVGRGNSIERKTANNFIVGTAAKSIVDNSFSLGGNNGVANQLDRLGAQLIENFDFSEEGDEEIENGSNTIAGANWNANANWDKTVAGFFSCDGSSNNDLNQGTTIPVIGKSYILSFEVLSINVGGRFVMNFGGVVGANRTSVGVYYETITATNTDRIRVRPNYTGTIGSVTNISVKELGQDWTLSANASIQNNELTLNGSGAFVYAQQTLWSSGAKNGRTLRFIYEVTENTLVSGERAQGLLRVGGYSGASLFPSVINLNSDVGTHILDVIVGIEGAHNVFDMYITSDYVSGYIKINYVSLQEVLPFVAPRQMTYLMFGKQTTDGNTKAANLNNTTGTFYVVPLNSASYFQCDVVAVRTGGTSTTGAIGDTASWTEKGVFTNVNQEGGLSISRERDTVRSIGTGTTNWRPTAVVGNTNGNFGLNIRGAADMIVEWAITVRITQIKTTF